MQHDEAAQREVEVTEALLRALPKTDLHCHLDGSLRLRTILELAEEQAVPLPGGSERSLARAIHMGERCGSLEAYLEAFDVTLSVLQTADALRRTAFELALDQAADGVRYFEVRFSPLLHQRRGLVPDAIVEAVVDGLRAAERNGGARAGVILCGIRTLDPAGSLRVAELAARWADRGVCGFDLAGAEAGHPASAHGAAFALAREANLSITCHAGEADGPASIADALHRCGAHRIGHGVRLQEDERLLAYVNDHRIPIECCPSSNVQTGAVRRIEDHPIRRYRELGLRVTVNTDNRLITDTTVSRELLLVHRACGLGLDDVIAIVLDGWRSAFLPWPEKRERLRWAQTEIDRILSASR